MHAIRATRPGGLVGYVSVAPVPPPMRFVFLGAGSCLTGFLRTPPHGDALACGYG